MTLIFHKFYILISEFKPCPFFRIPFDFLDSGAFNPTSYVHLPSFFYYETQLLRVNVNTKTKQETKEMSAKNILNFNVGVLGHVDRYIL